MSKINLFWSENQIHAFRVISDKVCVILMDDNENKVTHLPLISKRKNLVCRRTFAQAQTYQFLSRL